MTPETRAEVTRKDRQIGLAPTARNGMTLYVDQPKVVSSSAEKGPDAGRAVQNQW
jgi:hypothetical protein